jgi:hypothetical protein
MSDDLQQYLDETADLLMQKVSERSKPGQGARTAFDYWREAFVTSKENPDVEWIRKTADSAMLELLPHFTQK